MQNKILSNIESLIGNEKPHFLLAVSGGIDSMAMLDCFKKKSNQYIFSVCHVNHNYQENALLMEKLVSDACDSNIKCIVKQIVGQAPEYIIWHHGNRMLNYDIERGGIR